MRIIKLLLSAVIIQLMFAGCQSILPLQRITLVKAGKPNATIIIAKKPTRAAQLAAYELQEHIKLMTGATLPIGTSATGNTGIKLIVGDSQAARELGCPANFNDEEYTILFKPGAIIMLGKDDQDRGKVNYRNPRYPNIYDYCSWPDFYDQKGTLYAVYDFLEKYCDIRWFDQSEFGTDIPTKKTLTVTEKNLRRRPAFIYRDPQGRIKHNLELYNRGVCQWTVRWASPTPKYKEWLKMVFEKGITLPECKHPHRWLGYQRGQVYAFMLRNKLGGVPYKTNHSFYNWYDRFWAKNPRRPDLFKEHKPDYFAKGYPNAKVPPQLCYTNPDVLKQCLADIDLFYALPEDERKTKRLGTYKYYPVVPMDNANFCKCARCRKWYPPVSARKNFSCGIYSKIVWQFINKVAKGIKKKYPGKMISALAYASYAHKPQNMTIEDNIAVQLCLFPRYAAVNPNELNNDDMMLKQWADGRPIFLWLYTSWTTGHRPTVPMFPKPMGHYWAPLFQKYHKSGVKGMFFDGVAQESDMYFLFKLADNPYQDVQFLINDYFCRMYGSKAGPILQEFYTLVEKIYANPRSYPKGIKGPDLEWGILGTEERMKKLAALVERAEELINENGTLLQKKRFNIFKFGTWELMCEGRKKYLASKVIKSSKPISVHCPASWGSMPNGNLSKINWSDSQAFKGWNKDNGDISLRKIESSMICDDGYLYLKLKDKDLNTPPKNGDSWEILILDKLSNKRHTLLIDKHGNTSAYIYKNGVPQEWNINVEAISTISNKNWEIIVALPRKKLPLDKKERLFINCRRNDVNQDDSPVWVTTGNAFETGKKGAYINFDRSIPANLKAPSNQGLILKWDLKGSGKTIKDNSGNGNNGKIAGPAKRIATTGIHAIEFTGSNQYLEIDTFTKDQLKNFTFSCWINYHNANRKGSLRVLTVGPLRIMLVVPHQKLLLLTEDKSNKTFGAGPMGSELPPGCWHMLTFSFNGNNLKVYENGRYRGALNMKRSKKFLTNSVWYIGGIPKLHSWHTFLGKMSNIKLFNRSLSAKEIMSYYQIEKPHFLYQQE